MACTIAAGRSGQQRSLVGIFQVSSVDGVYGQWDRRPGQLHRPGQRARAGVDLSDGSAALAADPAVGVADSPSGWYITV